MTAGHENTGTCAPGGEAPERSPLVIVSPYPPAKNGIADYVAELIPYHLADFDVTLVVADDAPEPDNAPANLRILLSSEFRKYLDYFATAPILYHVGNNPAHCYMLDLLGVAPGIVVLHDYTLNYLHDAASLGWKDLDGYRQAHELEYGALGAEGVRYAFQKKERGQFATYELPLNGDVLEAATAVVTHSRYAQYKASARVPRTPVWCVPHHLTPRVEEFSKLSKLEARRQLGLPEHDFLVTALGFITYAKRIPMLLGALSELRTRVPEFRLVLGGEKRPTEYDVDADIAASGLKNCTISTGYLDEIRFFRHLAASDLIVNLRHPTGGESSGTLIRALGMGRPVLVFDHGPIGELPDEVVAKVPWNSDTSKLLTKALHELMTNHAQRTALGRRAGAYARSVHDIRRIADRYASIIRSSKIHPHAAAQQFVQHFPSARSVAQACRRPGSATAAKAPSADGELWWRSPAVPLGGSGQQAIVISSKPHATADLLSELFEWPSAAILAVTVDEFLAPKFRDASGRRIQAGRFAYALCIVSDEVAENRAAGLLRRLNAALHSGGSLTLEVCGRLNKSGEGPLSADLPQRIVDAGFAVLRSPNRQDGAVVDLAIERSDDDWAARSVCVLARKVSSYSVWRYTGQLAGMPQRLGGRVC